MSALAACQAASKSPALLSDFGRVRPGDPVSTLRFAQRWGILGFPQQGNFAGAQGDPLVWFWTHARTVRLALGIIRLLHQGAPSEQIAEHLDDHQFVRPCWEEVQAASNSLSSGGAPAMSPSFFERWRNPGDLEPIVVFGKDGHAATYLIGTSDNIVMIGQAQMPGESVASMAFRLLLNVINLNRVGIHQELYWSSPFTNSEIVSPRAEQRFAWANALSHIYEHLANMVVKNRIRICVNCATPFKQTHGGQRFCPTSGSKRSRCEMAYAKRQSRTKQEGRK